MLLTPAHTSLCDLQKVWQETAAVRLDPSSQDGVLRAHKLVADVAAGDDPIYGINTGFGKLASIKIKAHNTQKLQRNLILSHCCGVGEKLDRRTTRLMMVLKLLSLGRGASGVSPDTILMLEKMLEFDITPAIPSQGSVGASGDLAPLAHMAAVMIGEGEACVEGIWMSGEKALKQKEIQPITLGAKEGLALINGTQFSTACALGALFNCWSILTSSIIVSALSTDAIMGSTDPLTAQIHALRGQPGQIEVAEIMRTIMDGSEIRESHRHDDSRVQDPYCIRCQPQVTGAAQDLLRYAAKTLEIEANAATDNPLVLTESGKVVSGGNFHAEPVAFAADQIALAISEIGAIAQRRVALMVDPTLSHDLPAFLTPNPGLNSGMMIAEVTSAALMSENKHLANPCSTDSTPTSANQEDHVSMAAHAAMRLSRMNNNFSHIIAIEAMCAAQGIEFRAPLETSPILQRVMQVIRSKVPALKDDRHLSAEIEALSELVRSGAFSLDIQTPSFLKTEMS